MDCNWKKISLADVSEKIDYGFTASATDKNTGTKFLRITDIQNGFVQWEDVPFCEIDSSSKSKYLLSDGDIVVARTGNSTGENYLFQGESFAVFASYLIRFRVNKQIVDPSYVWRCMRSSSWWNFVRGSKTGSAQAGANAKVLGRFEFEYPPLHEQKAIAHILGTIDEKIELNKKTNETLEKIAKALFRSWFIDFDPVKAKAEGRSTGLPDEISDLFPDSFEDSELGQIPSGWIIQSLGSISKIFTGKRPKSRSEKETPLTKYPLYGGAGPMGFTNEILVNGSKIITTGRVGTLGKFFRIKIPAWISDNALIIEPSDIFYNFCFYRLLNFDITIFNRGSTQPLITQSDLKTIEMISADEKIHKIFEKLCSDLYEKFAINQSESNTLENIRNCLLPKLISGELKIPDAEKMIEEAEI